MTDQPRYRCHKEVSALKIAAVEPTADGGAALLFEGDFPQINVEHDMVRRYMPIAGDYLVTYDGDRYRSISPAKPFEDGYSRIE